MLPFRWMFVGLLTAIVWWPTTASSQVYVCPNGPGPEENQVGTTGGSNGVALLPLCEYVGGEDSSGSAEAEPNAPVWETQWGAIARGNAGGWGAVGDMLSEKSAKKAALQQCESTASTKHAGCKVSITYYNQCVAYTWGSGGGVSSSAVDVPTATERALKLCSKSSSDCEVLYTNCSYPRRKN
jgi:hypothetical protein